MKTGVILIFILISHCAFAAKSQKVKPSESINIKAQAPCASVLTEDIMGDLIDDLVQLRLRADQAFQSPDQINHAQLAFEKAYAELAREVPGLKDIFLKKYQSAQSAYTQSTVEDEVHKQQRVEKSRYLEQYRVSERTDIEWDPLKEKKLPVSANLMISFKTKSGQVHELDYRAMTGARSKKDQMLIATRLSDTQFATIAYDHTARIWQVDEEGNVQHVTRLGRRNNKKPEFGHTANLSFIAPLSGNRFITGSFDHTAIVWGLHKNGSSYIIARLGRAHNYSDSSLGHIFVVRHAAQISENRFITVSDDTTAIIWEIQTGNLSNHSHSNDNSKSDNGINKNAKILHRLGKAMNDDPTVGHTSFATHVSVIADGWYLTGSGGDDEAAIVWHVPSLGAPVIIQRLDLNVNLNGHTESAGKLDDAQIRSVDGQIFILTRDYFKRILLWEPVYSTSENDL